MGRPRGELVVAALWLAALATGCGVIDSPEGSGRITAVETQSGGPDKVLVEFDSEVKIISGNVAHIDLGGSVTVRDGEAVDPDALRVGDRVEVWLDESFGVRESFPPQATAKKLVATSP